MALPKAEMLKFDFDGKSSVCTGVREIVPHVVKLATEQGRMKFTRPLYRELYKTEFGKEVVETFKITTILPPNLREDGRKGFRAA